MAQVARPAWIVFDMDGVLVDVHESYRETIRATVLHFTQRNVTHEQIQDYKNQGGWNNDWLLAQRLCADQGVDLDYATVVQEFQRLFLGDTTTPGLMQREKWIDNSGALHRLQQHCHFAIFTGRLREEAQLTLDRFAAGLTFDPIIGDDDVTLSKPSPEGLLQIMERAGDVPLVYIGDTLDDAHASAAAGVPFIGIASPSNSRYDHVVQLLRNAGAIAILDDINQLETVFTS